MIRSKIFASRFKRGQNDDVSCGISRRWRCMCGRDRRARAKRKASRKDDIVSNTRPGIPLAGATSSRLRHAASGQPCTPLAQIYSDSALTQALANPRPLTASAIIFSTPRRENTKSKSPARASHPSRLQRDSAQRSVLTDFNSVNSGAISAFSLSLSGNLTVNGKHHRRRQSRSGTLNLSRSIDAAGRRQQRHRESLHKNPPTSRLYYKDDTGTGNRPVGTAAGPDQCAEHVHRAAKFRCQLEAKGPNPYFSLAAKTAATAAHESAAVDDGSINSGNTTLTLA